MAPDSPKSRSNCEPYRGVIESEFAKGRHAVSIYQHLVEHHGYEGHITPSNGSSASCGPTNRWSNAALKLRPVKKLKSTMVKARRRAIRVQENIGGPGFL